MSYILDALKKSEQERQQGTSPHLHSAHGSLPPFQETSILKKHFAVLLLSGGLFIITCGLGVFFYLHQPSLTEKPLTAVTEAPAESQTSGVTAAQPQEHVIKNIATSLQRPVEDQAKVQQPNAITESTPASDPPVVIEPKPLPASLPLLHDLPAELQAQIPTLKFAGHTFSKNPSQRMIIINGKILREGNMIDPNTQLAEITWDGVTIETNGTRFRVITN